VLLNPKEKEQKKRETLLYDSQLKPIPRTSCNFSGASSLFFPHKKRGENAFLLGSFFWGVTQKQKKGGKKCVCDVNPPQNARNEDSDLEKKKLYIKKALSLFFRAC